MSVLQSYLQGRLARQQQDAVDRENAMQAFLRERGGDIYAGDPQAMQEYAGYDLPGAMNARAMSENSAWNKEVRSNTRGQWAREAQAWAMELDDRQVAEEEKDLQNTLAALTAAQNAQQWDAWATENDQPDLVGQWDNREMLFAQTMTVAEALKMRSGGGGGDTEGEREINRLVNELGWSRQLAVAHKEGALKWVTDELNKTMRLAIINPDSTYSFLSEKQQQQVVDEGVPPPMTVPPEETQSSMADVDAAEATGLIPLAKQGINLIGGAIGVGQAFPQIDEARTALNNLSSNTMLTFAENFPGRPSNLTREKIEEMTLTTTDLKYGPEHAQHKVDAMVTMLARTIQTTNSVLQNTGNYTPQQRADAQKAMDNLERLYEDYKALQRNLGYQEKFQDQDELEAIMNELLGDG